MLKAEIRIKSEARNREVSFFRPVAVNDSSPAGAAGAAFSPAAQAGNLLFHCPGERHGLVQRCQDMIGRQLHLPRKSVIQRADDGLLDLRAAERVAGVDELGNIEL